MRGHSLCSMPHSGRARHGCTSQAPVSVRSARPGTRAPTPNTPLSKEHQPHKARVPHTEQSQLATARWSAVGENASADTESAGGSATGTSSLSDAGASASAAAEAADEPAVELVVEVARLLRKDIW